MDAYFSPLKIPNKSRGISKKKVTLDNFNIDSNLDKKKDSCIFCEKYSQIADIDVGIYFEKVIGMISKMNE